MRASKPVGKSNTLSIKSVRTRPVRGVSLGPEAVFDHRRLYLPERTECTAVETGLYDDRNHNRRERILRVPMGNSEVILSGSQTSGLLVVGL